MTGGLIDIVLHGDCLDVLRTLPDAYVDAIVTDPPYGLGTKEPTVDEIVAYLQGASLDTGGDFMRYAWEIPPVTVWRECFRVLKPGGYLFAFAGTRTFDMMGIGIRAAGFESRDTISAEFGPNVLQWIHGQGFPKSLNVSKAIDAQVLHGGSNSRIKRANDEDRTGGERVRGSAQNNSILGETRDGRIIRDEPATEDGRRWDGFGTALKPSWEPILVFRKPLEGTVADNTLKYGTGAMNIDGCRVSGGPGYQEEVEKNVAAFAKLQAKNPGWKNSSEYAPNVAGALKGRWPPNVLLVHGDHCRKVGTQRVKAPVINRFDDGMKPFGDGAGHAYTSTQTGDADGMEEIDIWACVENCPVRALNEQGAVSKGEAADTARFFPQFAPSVPVPFQYAAKVAKAEATVRGEVENNHPTKKPVSLMRWLVRLATRKGGLVLDPYCGSGTTCVAAVEEGMHFLGIERDPEFHAIASKRVGIVHDERKTFEGQRDVFDLMDGMPQEEP